MKRTDPFILKIPLPPGTAVIGPADWAAPLLRANSGLAACQDIDELLEAPRDLDAGADSDGTEAFLGAGSLADGHLVLLHGDHLRAALHPDVFLQLLERLISQRPDALPVLLVRELAAETCSEFCQGGLFAALQVPVGRVGWERVLARRHRWSLRARDNRQLLRESEHTTRLLHTHRRQLQQQAAQLGQELIEAQRSLETTHRELTEHMAQLSLLYKFGRELSSARNWDAVLRDLLESLVRFVGAAGAALVLRSTASGPFKPRQTFGWEETAWQRVLVAIEDQVHREVAEGILAPGVFRCAVSNPPDRTGRPVIITLPLEQQGLRLGYLLLLERSDQADRCRRHLPFLQTVQVILAEEVAGAQMLDRLREIGSFNARVLETVRSGIWVLDENGRTLYCNGSGRQLLTGQSQAAPAAVDPLVGIGRGRAAEPNEARPGPVPYDLSGLCDQPELFLDGLLQLEDISGVLFPQLLARDADPFRGEGSIVRPEGEVVPVLVQTSLMPGRDRGETWLVAVIEDLREAKKLEAERSRADGLEGLVEMSATLAHEIRNPLMGLSAQAELLADQLPAHDSRKRYLDVITAEVERINETINGLLNFVRPYEPKLACFSLLALARDSLDLVRPKAEAKAIQMILACEPHGAAEDQWLQVGDASQIKQVLLNLLLNALDASPPQAPVTVRLRRSGRIEMPDARRGTGQLTTGVILEVCDRGCGPPDGDPEQIFRPFFTTKSAGTGLGLSICRKIITAHRGEIRVERRSAETVFRILLPRLNPETSKQLRQEAS